MGGGGGTGGLKVGALGQTPGNAGLGPTQCYTFHLCKFTLRENYII